MYIYTLKRVIQVCLLLWIGVVNIPDSPARFHIFKPTFTMRVEPYFYALFLCKHSNPYISHVSLVYPVVVREKATGVPGHYPRTSNVQAYRCGLLILPVIGCPSGSVRIGYRFGLHCAPVVCQNDTICIFLEHFCHSLDIIRGVNEIVITGKNIPLHVSQSVELRCITFGVIQVVKLYLRFIAKGWCLFVTVKHDIKLIHLREQAFNR